MTQLLPEIRAHAHLDAVGPWADPVLWSRADVGRNYEGLPFPHRTVVGAGEMQRDCVFDAAATVPGFVGCEPVPLSALTRRELQCARESGLISAGQFKELNSEPFCLVSPDASLMLRTRDRDHVRLIARCSGLDPQAALRNVLSVERCLDRAVTFAYDDRFGYLTAEPARCGTGLALGCLVHLPALAFSGTAAEVLNEVGEQGLSTRGWFESEGRARGDLFILRSRRSLGCSEKTMAGEFTKLAARVVGLEIATREILLSSRRLELEDRIHRASGLLRNARLMSLSESYDHISFTRLGAATGLLAGPDAAAWNRLLVDLRPGHLGIDPAGSDPDDDLIARAAHLRKFFS